MDKNGNQLAIASIPCQKWKSVYEPAAALRKGTIFPELNLPFFMADDTEEIPAGQGFDNGAEEKSTQQEEREQLLSKIDEAGFVVNDLTLYLDTHCEDSQAIQLFAECAALRADLLKIFSERFYPLTQACLANCSCEKECESVNGMAFSWECGPAPWEGACV